MLTIGITGGVGAGKSLIMDILQNRYGAFVLKADEAAHLLEEPGEDCYNKLLDTFGNGILAKDGHIDKFKFASLIFSDEDKLKAANAIIHPAVRVYIIDAMERERAKGTGIFALEAALLIEEHYDEILDELWYIYVPVDIRRQRLKSSRGYTDEKINNIFSSQLPEEVFRKYCRYTVDNSGSVEHTSDQIDALLKDRVSG